MTNEQYYDCIQPYQNACQIMRAKLEVLNGSLYQKSAVSPIHNIQERIKSKRSIEKKLEKLGHSDSVQNAKDHLRDIAGIRVICYFIDDIYNLVNALKRQSELIFIREKDYIQNPKPNGYRSLHVIIAVPVYYLDTMEYFPVEIQLRTMTMDLWASMEHRVCYKKLPEHRDELAEAFCQYADILGKIEEQFEAYNETGMLEEITSARLLRIRRRDKMEIEEEFVSGFCRTMNGGETVCCEYTRQEDGSRKLTFMDCAHERCVNTGACEIFKQVHELEQK